MSLFRRPASAIAARIHAPVALLAVLGVLLAVGPVGLALSHPRKQRPRVATQTLAQIAREAECRLTEYERDPRSNPPVSGRVDERISAADGSYAGRRPPPTMAGVHALLHGRVVVQYRPDLAASQVAALDRLVRRTPAQTLLFANQTRMPYPVAATAYLTLMTCPRVDARTLEALRAFRARRTRFGQAF